MDMRESENLEYKSSLTAIREAVTNAVVHRDYTDSGNVQVRIFDDRLEIWSPGLLPKELNAANLLEESRSIPRNRVLAQLFHDIEMMEGWGTGFQRIVNGSLKNGNTKPVFQEKTGAFVVIFQKRMANEGVNEGVNELLPFIKKNPGERSVQITLRLNKPQKTIERWLSRLKKDGKIVYKGSSKKGGYYAI